MPGIKLQPAPSSVEQFKAEAKAAAGPTVEEFRAEFKVAVQEQEFLVTLEQAVRKILSNKKATPETRLAAITAGTKLLAIKHRINGGDEKGFFDQ